MPIEDTASRSLVKDDGRHRTYSPQDAPPLRPLAVVHVNTHDDAGGAARIARDLHEGLLGRGDKSILAVGYKRSTDPSVRLMDNYEYRNSWARLWHTVESALERAPVSFRGKGRLTSLLTDLALPGRVLAVRRGVDYFGYPAAWHPEDWAASAELIHLHNLHGGYFDLRALPTLTARYPTVLTLHDAWLLAGHCAHSFDCERWQMGCGNCPDLSISPAIRRDSTGLNWRTKRDIFAASRLYVVTPSQWLMNKVQASMLAPAIGEARVVPHGVDLQVFRPHDKRLARAALGLPHGTRVLVFAAAGGRTNPWKDFSTIEAAAIQACRILGGQMTLVVLGGRSGSEDLDKLRLQYVPYVSDRHRLALYLAAADVCVHAARAESFSLWLSESLACGTPAVSVRIGGIPEVVKDGVTGLLVHPGDTAAFSRALVTLLQNDELRNRMGRAASEYAVSHFGLDRMVDDYRCFYQELLEGRSASKHG